MLSRTSADLGNAHSELDRFGYYLKLGEIKVKYTFLLINKRNLDALVGLTRTKLNTTDVPKKIGW